MTGQGIASALVRHLIDQGLRASATDLYAGVVHGNNASVRALMKNGFTRVATFDTYDRYHPAIQAVTTPRA